MHMIRAPQSKHSYIDLQNEVRRSPSGQGSSHGYPVLARVASQSQESSKAVREQDTVTVLGCRLTQPKGYPLKESCETLELTALTWDLNHQEGS